jgi:hypothetical protein
MANAGADCHGHNLGAPVGDAHGTNSGCGIVQHSNVPTLTDPYSGLAPNIPANPCGASFPGQSWSGTKSANSYTICGDLTLSGDVTFNATGNTLLVIENGQLDLAGNTMQTATGTGLTIVFTAPSADYSNSAYQHTLYCTSGNKAGL